jgi:hypothetical protein
MVRTSLRMVRSRASSTTISSGRPSGSGVQSMRLTMMPIVVSSPGRYTPRSEKR